MNNESSQISGDVKFLVMSVVCIIGVLENLLSFVAILHVTNPKFKGFCVLLANLCMSDMLFLCSICAYFLLEWYKPNYTGTALYFEIACTELFVYYVYLTNIYCVAFMTMALVGYISFQCLHPFAFERMEHNCRKKMVLWATFIWVVSASFGFLQYILFATSTETELMSVKCICYEILFNKQTSVKNETYYIIGAALLLFVILSFIIILLVVHIKLYLVVRGRQRDEDVARRSLNNNHGQDEKMRRRRFNLNTIFIVYGVLVLTWIPLALIYLFCGVLETKLEMPEFCNKHFLFWSRLALVFNAISDPIIYGLRLSAVRKAYVKMIHNIFKICYRHHTTPRDSCTRSRLNSNTRMSIIRLNGSANGGSRETSTVAEG